ncbi:MAG: NifU family protein [Rhizomicrobium sp.]
MIAENELAEPASEAATERYKLIEEAIAELRPYLKADGGDCELISVDGNLVTVKLHGACVGCQLSSATLNGVQERLITKLGFPLRIALAKPSTARPVQIAHH